MLSDSVSMLSTIYMQMTFYYILNYQNIILNMIITNNCSNAIYDWLTDNKLPLNTDISELFNIPSNYSNFPQICINNNEITPSMSKILRSHNR